MDAACFCVRRNHSCPGGDERDAVPPLMTTKSSQLSVIMPCLNEVTSIEKTQSSVLRQQRPTEQFEVIVADGMSDDGTRELLETIASAHPEVRVIDNPARIQAAGLNAAIAVAKGQVVVRMDAHTDYAPDDLRECMTE